MLCHPWNCKENWKCTNSYALLLYIYFCCMYYSINLPSLVPEPYFHREAWDSFMWHIQPDGCLERENSTFQLAAVRIQNCSSWLLDNWGLVFGVIKILLLYFRVLISRKFCLIFFKESLPITEIILFVGNL